MGVIFTDETLGEEFDSECCNTWHMWLRDGAKRKPTQHDTRKCKYIDGVHSESCDTTTNSSSQQNQQLTAGGGFSCQLENV